MAGGGRGTEGGSEHRLVLGPLFRHIAAMDAIVSGREVTDRWKRAVSGA